ncbi:MAG: hypothetical protein ACSLFM_05955 [Tepidiformaceae bacterium]
MAVNEVSPEAVSVLLVGGRFDGVVLELDEAPGPELRVPFQASGIPELWRGEMYLHAPELEVGDGQLCYRADGRVVPIA